MTCGGFCGGACLACQFTSANTGLWSAVVAGASIVGYEVKLRYQVLKSNVCSFFKVGKVRGVF